jgi:hypothetical protein
LSNTLLFDEAILEAMMLSEQPWEDNHHQSSILPPLIEEGSPLQTEASDNCRTHSPSTSYGVSSEGNLSKIFMHCRHYNIRLNPHKCIFGVELGRLLGLIVANDGIHVDPLKLEAITNLPLPHTILQLQSLQGRANFLRRFIVNYAKITKGFMCLLMKGVPFIWDDWAQ